MRQILEEIIKEWQNWQLPEIKTRDTDLTTYFDKKIKKIISVIGFRRVGKTFLLFDLAKKIGQKNCLYLNLEDERLPKKTEVLTHFIDLVKELTNNQKLVLLIDEIQNIPDWSRWARRINETSDYFLIITGSSSKLSSFEIPTQLRGRTISVKLNPLNFREFLNFKEEQIDLISKNRQLNLLREYLTFGGLPEIVLTETGKKHLIIEEYFRTFLTRDIFERYGLRQKEAFRALIRILLNSSYLTVS